MERNIPGFKHEILKHLQHKYIEKGKNFYFKARQLKLDYIDSRLIGRILKQLEMEGALDLWTEPTSTHDGTYLTKFEGA